MGFAVPLDSWLRGPLRCWAEALLSTPKLEEHGIFDSRAVRALWIQHQAGTYDWQYHLWDVLVFQQWINSQANVFV